jgi:uncharacterized protein YycO
MGRGTEVDMAAVVLAVRLLVPLLVVLATGCLSAPSVMVERPRDPVLDDAITRAWVDEIRRVAEPGDWLLSRSYSAVGDAIVVVTDGIDLSHASMIDPGAGTVIEAVMPAVQETRLEDFVRRNRYVIVVRPRGMDREERRRGLERARGAVGARFDIGGLLGLGSDREFYCSELVYWASGAHALDPEPPVVIAPGHLLGLGEVVYVSGVREDEQTARRVAALTPDRVSTMDTSATPNGTVAVDGVAIQETGVRRSSARTP